jgi:hypothetical protein
MLWFAAVAFCSSALNNVFVTYMFSSFLRTQCTAPGQTRPPTLSANAPLTQHWFLLAQCTFAVWNAVNDPLAGWLSDTVMCKAGGSGSALAAAAAAPPAPAALHRRAWVVRWGGLCWCLFFALAWFPPSAAWGAALAPALPWLPACLTGLHFLCCLCLYDAALTLVEVNHAALLSDVQPLEEAAQLPPLQLPALPQQPLASSAGAAAGGPPAAPQPAALPPFKPSQQRAAATAAAAAAAAAASTTNHRRVRANTWVACAMAVGAVTSLPAHWAWEADCRSSSSSSSAGAAEAPWWWPGYFRCFAVGLAGACCVIFWCAADGLLEEQEEWAQDSSAGQGSSSGGSTCGGSSGRRSRWAAGGRKGSTASGISFSGSGSGAWGGGEEGSHTLRHRAVVASATLAPRSPSRALDDAPVLRAPESSASLRPSLSLASGNGAGGTAGAAAVPTSAAAGAAESSFGATTSAAASLFFSSQASPALSPNAGFVKREGTPTFLSPASGSGGRGSSGSLFAAAGAASATAPAAASPSHRLSYRTFLRHLLALPSLRSYVAIATLQAFDCSFGKSFYTLFLAVLWSQALGERGGMRLAGGTQALLVCASFLLPHALTLMFEPLVMALGIRRVLKSVVLLRTGLALAAALGALAWLSPRPLGWWLPPAAASAEGTGSLDLAPLFLAAIGYQLLSRVTSETVCRNLSLLKAAVVDDFRRAQGARGAAASSWEQLGAAEEGGGAAAAAAAAVAAAAAAVAEKDRPAALIGAADFFPRVASSAAPVLGYLLLQWGGSMDAAPGGTAGAQGGAVAPPSTTLLLLALVAVPGTIAAVQSTLLKGD